MKWIASFLMDESNNSTYLLINNLKLSILLGNLLLYN